MTGTEAFARGLIATRDGITGPPGADMGITHGWAFASPAGEAVAVVRQGQGDRRALREPGGTWAALALALSFAHRAALDASLVTVRVHALHPKGEVFWDEPLASLDLGNEPAARFRALAAAKSLARRRVHLDLRLIESPGNLARRHHEGLLPLDREGLEPIPKEVTNVIQPVAPQRIPARPQGSLFGGES